MKRPLSLHGNAQEILLRAKGIIETMIVDILRENPVPAEQSGEVVVFPRRKPEEGDMAELPDLKAIFDFIRMLDADGYPKAYLETGRFRLEFSRASLQTDSVVADVRITKK